MVSGDLVGHDVEERGQRAGVAADHPGLRQLSDRVDLAISFVGPWCGPVAMVLSSDPVYNDFFNSFGRELALTRDAVSELKILGLVFARSVTWGIPSIHITGCGDDSEGPCVTL